MKNAIVFLCFAFLGLSGCSAETKLPVEFRILDQRNAAVEGALVRVFVMKNGSGYVLNARSGGDGTVAFSIKSSEMIDVIKVSKEGYYLTEVSWLEVSNSLHPDGGMVGIELILRRRENPISMYAIKSHKLQVHEANKKYGYDFIVNDWVEPIGTGKVNDAYISVNGYFKNYNEYDTILNISFPNQGDGILAMTPFEYSELLSPYIAPSHGYVSQFEARQFRTRNLERKPASFDPEYIVVNEYNEHAIYAIRIRTEYDQRGDVRSAYYGKIYGGIKFGGATSKGSYVKIGAIYINPTANSRIIEYSVGDNLYDESTLDFVERPVLP